MTEIERGVAIKDVSKTFNVPKKTLSTWKKNRDKIVTSFKSSGGTKRQRIKEGTYVQVNLACFKWLLLQRSENIPIQIHGKIIREKALEFAKELNLEKFQASDGWLHSWKARYNISLKEVSGESKSVTREMTAAWNETSLPTILSRYELKDIYNADDFGLFYQGLSKKTLHLKSEKCSGGKYSKLRLTGMAIFSINMWLKSHNIEAMSDGTVPYPIQNSNHQNSNIYQSDLDYQHKKFRLFPAILYSFS